MRVLWSGAGLGALFVAAACGGGTVSGSGGTGDRSTPGGHKSVGTGGDDTCVTGDEGCDCYPNDTCNDRSLTCASHLCVRFPGTGGAGATPSVTGGFVGLGGFAVGATGSGGFGAEPFTGGRNTGGLWFTGGTSAGAAPHTGGVSTGAVSGGGTTTGGVPPATGGSMAGTGGVISMGGTAGTSTGGVPPATGGAPPATGGAPGTGGSASSCMSHVLDSSPLQGFCFALMTVGGVQTDGDVETMGLAFDYTLPGTSYDDFAVAGCNINQDVSGVMDPPAEEVTIAASDRICVEGSGFQRIQIQDAAGNWWCAAPLSTCVVASDFNTACWDDSGDVFSGGPIQQILAQQPSDEGGDPITGTICITDIRLE